MINELLPVSSEIVCLELARKTQIFLLRVSLSVPRLSRFLSPLSVSRQLSLQFLYDSCIFLDAVFRPLLHLDQSAGFPSQIARA